MISKYKLSEKSWFRYIVIFVILFIPFIYSFFYLKAYWDPYGKGNMDNLPVAIVNEDKGDKGKELTDKLVDSKTLNFDVENRKNANNGLNNKKYYAVILIPEDFTKDLESAKEENKYPATITYSPNQKSNYLASQIISRVLLTVEKEVRSDVSKEVTKTLSGKIKETEENVEKINDGMVKISDGTSKLKDGSEKLKNGSYELKSKYNEFDSGIVTVNNGANDLKNGMASLDNGLSNLQNGLNEFASKASGLQTLQGGISSIASGYSSLNAGISNYVGSVNTLLDNLVAGGAIDSATANTLKTSGSTLSGTSSFINTKLGELNTGASSLSSVTAGVSNMQNGVNDLKNGSSRLLTGLNDLSNGTSRLASASNSVKSGISSISNGTISLEDGINTLNEGTNSAHEEISSKLENAKSEIKKLDGIDKFTANPVNLKEKDVNKVSSYGTAFAPFFMSIALWVGALMLFIILYYDANDRFKLLSRNAENKLLRTACYLGLASLQGIMLGILLMIGLDLNITNYFLYFGSLVLVACLFESIMEALIVNMGDIGKFMALIILVLQLAAAGGTFPIQTVTKGFRWLYNFLPMKYTCDLFKETVITIESNLVSNSIFVIFIAFIVLLSLNIYKDKTKKD